MIKITYIGPNAEGRVSGQGFSFDVRRGEIYSVPEETAEQLMRTAEWKIVSEVEVKKVKNGKF